MEIADSPNMVCTVNHAMDVLQWRSLILQIQFVRLTMPQRIYSIEYQILLVALPCESRNSEGKRKKTWMVEGTVITGQEERERNKRATINDTILVSMCNGHH